VTVVVEDPHGELVVEASTEVDQAAKKIHWETNEKTRKGDGRWLR
jgi:hypothetical protein